MPSARAIPAIGVVWVACLVTGCLPLPRAGHLLPPVSLPDRIPDSVSVNLVESTDKAGTLSLELTGPPAPEPTFTLSEAMARAVLANPRLLVYRSAIERSAGAAGVAFAPFLPQADILTRAGAVNSRNGPGAPGIVGGIVPSRIDVPYSFAQTELQIQWTLHDFGRTSGRFGQAVSREKIAGLQYGRARETVAFDAATAYLQGLQTRAIRVIQEEAIKQANAVLDDTRARQEAGVALREAVLRAEVQVSEAREGLVFATEDEQAAEARLNNVLGRDANLPVRLVDRETTPALDLSLEDCLRLAAQQRLEVGVVREAVAAALQGREATAAEFLPKIYLLSGLGNIQGENVLPGWAAGVGIHVSQPLYQGGKRRAELHIAEADVQEALAQARVLLDAITLEVTLAYRHATAARRRIDLDRPAVTQATENMRLMRIRYRNGDATPTDIVDAQTILTRSRQRLASAVYEYQMALARLDHALGNTPGCLLEARGKPPAAELPALRPLPDTLPPPRPVEMEKLQQKKDDPIPDPR